jgi:hypothetical protein
MAEANPGLKVLTVDRKDFLFTERAAGSQSGANSRQVKRGILGSIGVRAVPVL